MRKFNKTLITIFLLIVVMVVALTGCSGTNGSEVVNNYDFETIGDNEVDPEGWTSYRSEKTPDSNFTRVPVAVGSVGSDTLGKSYYSIELTTKPGVAYFYQEVKLYAGRSYQFDVDYKIENKLVSESGNSKAVGAYFGFLEDPEYLTLASKKVTDNEENDDWVHKTVYFSPNKSATYTLVAGIGREDVGGAKGKVAFDNISINSISAKDIPVGTTTDTISTSHKFTSDMAGGVAYTVVLAIFGVALLVGAYFAVKIIIKKDGYREAIEENIDGSIGDNNIAPTPSPKRKKKIKSSSASLIADTDVDSTIEVVDDAAPIVDATPVASANTVAVVSNKAKIIKALKSPVALFIYVLMSAFLVRFLFLLTTNGMVDQMVAYGELALLMGKEGISSAYSGSLILPSGMLYILYIIGLFTEALGITAGSAGMAMLIRIPNVIADIVTCYLIFMMLSKHYNYKISAVFAGTYALLPAIFTATTTWGMSVSIPIACMLGMFIFLFNKNFIGFNALFTLALIFSYSAIILLPLVIALDIYYCVINKKYILPVCITVLVSFAVFYAVGVPFAIEAMNGTNPSAGVFLVFTKMFDSIGANNLISHNAFNFYAIFGLGNTLSSTGVKICVAVTMVIFASLAFYMFYQSNNYIDSIFLAAMSFIVWAVFGIGSQTEYMVIGISLLFVYATLKTERRLFIAMGILAIASFINIAVLQTNSGYISNYPPTESAGLIPFHYLDATYIIGSIVVTLATVYLFYIAYDIMIKQSECDIKPMSDNYLSDTRESIVALKNRTLSKFKRK